ncbi:MAG: hypothetical protein QOG67_1050 [Verrucomicrobiota bacterium]|jgi:hypothetical protein
MKKFITILISCSLTLAASAMAQQDEEQQKPKKSQPANEAQPAPKPHAGRKGQAETKAPGQESGAPKAEATPKMHAGGKGRGKQPADANVNANADVNASPGAADVNARGKGRGAGRNKPGNANVNANADVNASPGAVDTNVKGKGRGAQGRKGRNAPNVNESTAVNKAAASPSPANAGVQSASPAAVQANAPAAQGGARVNAQAKKVDPQTVQTIKTEHANFRAQPRPDKVPAVTFNQSYRISGSDQWQGEKYGVFRSYHPEMHDRNWYHSRYPRVELIGGGYYYWNNGYWYPAWGYDNSAQYYAYDGPIYVGHRAEPPDRVIADVQAVLQHEGYYQGEVDGLLGPLTRQALTAYQADHGLYTTAAIDEPTLSSLDLG